MFSKSLVAFTLLSVLSVTQPALGRERWLERDNRAVFLHPRRFGQENPAVLQKLGAACGGGVCATLAGQAIGTLLAGAGECAQQDLADQIIDAGAQFDAATQQNLIAIAIEFRQAEKNTPPDFTTNPPTLRNSVFCQKAPKNAQLNGLVQAQDPGNDPNIFFDPATRSSVARGSQANTVPFGQAAGGNARNGGNAAAPAPNDLAANPNCAGVVTVSVTGTAAVATNTAAVTVSVGGAAPTAAPAAGNIGDFGSCTVPQIEFGVGFDNRRETSFQPVDKVSYAHGSAQNVNIITQFICDTLVNKCGADAQARATCATAKTAVAGAASGTGAQADAFNRVFGIVTNFVAVVSVNNQGQAIAGTGAPNAAAPAPAPANVAPPPAAAAPANNGNGNGNGNVGNAQNNAVAGGIGDFGSCSVPEIEFGVGFDGRRETSFQPADKASFSQGSAQNINIITRAVCDTLVNRCGADQTARDTCARAQSAAAAATAKTGAQADAFNAVFGISTNFAAVQAFDDQGRPVAGTGAGNANAAAGNNNANVDAGNNNANNAANNNNNAANNNAANNNNAGNNNNAAAAGGNLQAFSAALGGVVAPTVTATGNGQFQVQGNASFNNLQSALVRSCDVQNNQCANAANASGNQANLTVAQCNAQQQQCLSQARA